MYYFWMRPQIVRSLLMLGALVFFIDGVFHRYQGPLAVFTGDRTIGLIFLLGTRSREGTDTWLMLLCLLLAYWHQQREQASRD